MENSSLFLFVGALLLHWLLISALGRKVAIAAVLIILLVATHRLFVRTHACSAGFAECYLELQPATYGPCVSSNRSGLLNIDGVRYLAAEAGIAASATCINVAALWE